MSHLDLIVIGAGSAGLAAAFRADELGAAVALVDPGPIGGTCVHRGCIPKKLLMYAADYGQKLSQAATFGWQSGALPPFNMAHWQQAKQTEISRIEQHYQQRLQQSSIQWIQGKARILAPHQVQIGQQQLQAERILIATGSRPAMTRLPGLEYCATSDQLLALQELPDRAAILGSGYIGVEFASLLAQLGVEVSLYYRSELPLSAFDQDLRQRIAQALSHQHIKLYPQQLPQRIEPEASGLCLIVDDERRHYPWVLNALGRIANTEDLGLTECGIAQNPTGHILIDSQFATSVAGIYALGDVGTHRALTPVAATEGQRLAEHWFSASPLQPISTIPTALFSLPPAASCGLNEAQCPTGSLVFETEFQALRDRLTGEPNRCYLKLLVAPDHQRLLGLHMFGAQAPEIIQSLAVSLQAQASLTDLQQTCALHPTLAEEWLFMRTPSRVVA